MTLSCRQKTSKEAKQLLLLLCYCYATAVLLLLYCCYTAAATAMLLLYCCCYCYAAAAAPLSKSYKSNSTPSHPCCRSHCKNRKDAYLFATEVAKPS